jgi:adhesin transport system membrane fusion protein
LGALLSVPSYAFSAARAHEVFSAVALDTYPTALLQLSIAARSECRDDGCKTMNTVAGLLEALFSVLLFLGVRRFRTRVKAINDELEVLQAQLKLAHKELEMTEPLLKQGDVSAVEVIRLQRQVNDLRGQIANKRNKYQQDSQAELAKAEEDLAGVMEVLTQKKEQLDRVELRAPMAGIVKNVRITTLGGVIKPGEEVMQIVPVGDDLMIEAKVRPADIAFLKPGLEAIVKIDAYDYSIYGGLKGKLTYISADTISEETKSGEQTYYRVQIQTDGKQFSARPKESLEIQPGMTAQVEIITGSNTVLSYLMKPITKTLQESLKER